MKEIEKLNSFLRLLDDSGVKKIIGVNIKKYLRFISSGYIPSFWVAPDNLQPEIQKPIKVKLSKPSYKSKNKINKMEDKYKSKKTAKS